MECRKGCGACCIHISISSPIPGMPAGKPAGARCIHLTQGLCGLFGKPERPDICSTFRATEDICGSNNEEAIVLISRLEQKTKPRTSMHPNEPETPDDRPATKEEEEAWGEFCMLMSDFVEECDKVKEELDKLSEVLTDEDNRS